MAVKLGTEGLLVALTRATYGCEADACEAARVASQLAGEGVGYGIAGEYGAYRLVRATAQATAGGGLAISFD